MAYISKAIQDNQLLLMMDRKSYMRFHFGTIVFDLVTWRGQIEVRHISQGCNLETLADTAKCIINDG